LPSFSLIASAGILGLGLSQMMLKLSTISTALAFDVMERQFVSGIRQRILGAGIVLAGVAFVAFGAGAAIAVDVGPVVLLCLFGTFASGAGFVLQTRLSSVSQPSRLAANAASDKVEVTAAAICQLTSAVVQVGVLSVLTFQGSTSFQGLPLRLGDTPLWLFEGLQGAFFLRSMQVLSKRVGLATTFTTSLCGQLLTAAALDSLQGGGSGGIMTSPARWVGLGLVICGAAISSGKGRMEETGSGKSSARILNLRVKYPWFPGHEHVPQTGCKISHCQPIAFDTITS